MEISTLSKKLTPAFLEKNGTSALKSSQEKNIPIQAWEKAACGLAHLEKRLSSTLQYAHGFADGVNPLTPLTDQIQKTLSSKRPDSMNTPSYWEGREQGAKLSLIADTATAATGTWLAGTSTECAVTTAGVCLPVATPGTAAGTVALGLGTALMVAHGKNLQSAQENQLNGETKEVHHVSETVKSESPNITAEELTGKTRTEIREMAKEKGLEPFGDKSSPDYPRKWKDPITHQERVRLDRGHIFKSENLNGINNNFSVDHVHGYEPNGETRIYDLIHNDHHFPTNGE